MRTPHPPCWSFSVPDTLPLLPASVLPTSHSWNWWCSRGSSAPRNLHVWGSGWECMYSNKSSYRLSLNLLPRLSGNLTFLFRLSFAWCEVFFKFIAWPFTFNLYWVRQKRDGKTTFQGIHCKSGEEYPNLDLWKSASTDFLWIRHWYLERCPLR